MPTEAEHACDAPAGAAPRTVPRVGAVVIGRNEGAKLGRCLASVVGQATTVVYVDSGSVDDSVAQARAMDIDVVALDPAIPFTVARARNAGFDRLIQRDPAVELVQFVDGDSEMVASWFAAAAAAALAEPRVAVVFGSLRERFPQRSLFTRFYSVAYDPRLADPDIASGIAMMRVDAFRAVGGFVPALTGFEDREISLRLRQAGWQVRRLDAAMAVHEAGMDRFSLWWRRCVNGGRSLAREVALRHPLDAYAARAAASSWFWGLILPGGALVAAWPTNGASLFLFAGHCGLAARIYRGLRRQRFERAGAGIYALLCTAAKVPLALGLAHYHLERFAAAVRRRG